MLVSSADGERLVISILIKSFFPSKLSSLHLSKSSSSFSSTWFKARNIRVCDKLEMRPQLKIPGREIQFPLLPISSSFSHLLLHIINSRSFCAPPPSPFTFIDISALGFGVLIISIIGIKRESAFYPE